MLNKIKFFLALIISMASFSMAQATSGCFIQDAVLVKALKAKQLKVIVLCNFQALNNAENIVVSDLSPGFGLTAKGLNDLNNLVPVLANENISAIYSGLSFRLVQTSNLLGTALNLTPDQLIVDKRLAMQNFGLANRMNYNDYKELFASQQQMFEGVPPGGETGCSVFARIDQFLNDLTTVPNGETVLILTHGFNVCYISKVLTGKYGNIPSPGQYAIYDYSSSK